MSGQFFFTLLNPAVAAILATTYVVLWRKRPDQTHLALLALGFSCCGLAFVLTDFLSAFEAPLVRILANALFFVALAAACISALSRVQAPIPVRLFSMVAVAYALGFCWFLFLVPSIEARIYVGSAAYVVLTTSTAWLLFQQQPQRKLDWLFIILALAMTAMTILRPLAVMLHQLDIDSGGSFRDSAYWATIQALTPIIAIGAGLAFLIALAIKTIEEVSLEANRDYLTGLLNRRGFDQGISSALSDQPPLQGQPAVLIADIDDFKLVNDSFGHAVGDEVIAGLARILLHAGKADLAARTGGEEFTLFYRSATPDQIMANAEAIREALATASLARDHRVTVSMGLHLRAGAETMNDMLTAADRALYDAKRAGKDRAVLTAAAGPASRTKDPVQKGLRRAS